MKKLVIGILAHVDAGKTTLTESILYRSGKLRSMGRVDHGDAYLDTAEMEKERGITIFSKQARFSVGDLEVCLLDTPGHVDFSAEMERTLSVLDYAILVISGASMVQSHTETLWRLLDHYKVPVFLFVNKMDQPGTEAEAVLRCLQEKLDGACTDFRGFQVSASGEAAFSASLCENLALSSESCMEQYLESGSIGPETVREMIRGRQLFPVFFGAALKAEGVDLLLQGLQCLTLQRLYPAALSGRVFKIARDENGQRLSYLKLTGGMLRNRMELLPGEKITEIRLYSGSKYEAVESVEAGMVCAITGISGLQAGDGIGESGRGEGLSLKPVLDYEIFSEDTDTLLLYQTLRGLSDEFPELHLRYDSELKEIHVQLMGEVQTEILARLVRERFGLTVHFGSGSILYQESIAEPVEGVGHFEPLRHYAEVHLLLEPLPRGSGLQFATDCREEMLAGNWQRLVLQHLREREHVGVLTGAPITDMRITLIAGKAHLKHTEGGDFREATWRAVRQGLRKAVNVLLEPFYAFQLRLPQEYVGRAMTDISNMQGSFEAPETENGMSVLSGRAPVVSMRDYQKEVMIYTKGRGQLFLRLDGYEKCHNADEVILNRHYDPDADLLNPCSSVFCAHGSGFIVPFDEVENYMQVPSPLAEKPEVQAVSDAEAMRNARRSAAESYRKAGHYIGDAELEDIFIGTYGQIRNRAKEVNEADARTIRAKTKEENLRKAQENRQNRGQDKKERVKQYLLVDGYNIVFSWPELKALAAENLDGARGRLLEILSNFQGYTEQQVIAVFDAYRVQGHAVEQFRYHNIEVVFTKEAQTADEYIEQLSHKLSEKHQVTIATSDQVVQVITWSGTGVRILSAESFLTEVEHVNREIRTEHLKSSVPGKSLGGQLQIPAEIEIAMGEAERQQEQGR